MKKYFWKKCYELPDGIHWALCDTENDKNGSISSLALILLSTSDMLCRIPVDKDKLMERIVLLLNEDEQRTHDDLVSAQRAGFI